MTDTDTLLAARHSTHGEYLDHARVTQSLLDVLHSGPNWDALPMAMRESLHMFCHKMGRVVVGDPYEPDHWADVAGYARLIEQRLQDGRLRRFGDSSSPVGNEEAHHGEGPIRISREPCTLWSNAGDAYTSISAALGLPREEVKTKILAHTYGAEPLVPRREPTGPGTPDDGGHHAAADEEAENLERETAHPGTVTQLAVGDLVDFKHPGTAPRFGGVVTSLYGNIVCVRWPNGTEKSYHWSVLSKAS